MEKTAWIKSRKKLLAQVKGQIFAIQGRDQDIDTYARQYKKEFRGKWKPTDYEKMLEKVSNCSIVLAGDFHAFSQSQRAQLRLLREWPDYKRLVLAFECIESKHQKVLSAYMAFEMSEDDFLKSIDWQGRWGYSWDHYRPLFEFARINKIPVYAVNKFYKRRSLLNLSRRDEFSAKKLIKICKNHPESTIFCLYGDLHLAEEHLPRKIHQLSGSRKIKVARIFLNSERLYFSLAKKNLESKVEVMSHSRQRYCVMSSPPWVKWQSYLMYLEGTYDDDLDDDFENLDFTDHVARFVGVIANDLSLKVDTSQLEVYTGEDFQISDRLAGELPQHKQKIFLSLIEEEQTFMLPENNFYFLSRISINHCAHLAGFYVHKILSGVNKNMWNMPKDFHALIWSEALAFFLSKFINHKRKSDKMSVIRTKLKYSSEKDNGRESLALILDQKADEWIYVRSGRRKKIKLKVKNEHSYIQAAKILGSMMGEKIYSSYEVGRVTKDEVYSMLSHPMGSENFSSFYYLMVKRFAAHKALKGREYNI